MSVDELNAYIDKKVAEQKGFPCAGKLVEYSVMHRNYTEWSRGGGLFASHIRKTRAYKTAKKRKSRSFKFTKKDSRDLYYGLHKVKSNFHYTKAHPTHIHDKFDFNWWTKYNNPMTTAINNWGYLSSKAGILYESTVDIYF